MSKDDRNRSEWLKAIIVCLNKRNKIDKNTIVICFYLLFTSTITDAWITYFLSYTKQSVGNVICVLYTQ